MITCCLTSVFLHAAQIPLAETPFSQIWTPKNEKKESITFEHSLPIIETPKYGASNTYVGKILSKDKLETFLVLSTKSLVREERESIPFKHQNTLPRFEAKKISLSSGPLKNKHFIESELYPDFVPFGQWWLKDPLGSFTYYREQLTTSSMVQNQDCSIEDSLLEAFLASSISRVDQSLDSNMFGNNPINLGSNSQSYVVNSLLRQLPLLPTAFNLNYCLDLYDTLKFSDMPLLASLINHEDEREIAKACYQDLLTPDELDVSFDTFSIWENDLIGKGLQFISNRAAKSIFHCTPEDPFASPQAAIVLSELLSSKETLVDITNPPHIAMTHFPYQNFLSFLARDELNYRSDIVFEEKTQLSIDSSSVPDSVPFPLNFDPPTSREGPFGYTETISSYAVNVSDEFIDVDPNFAAYRNKIAVFSLSLSCNDTSILQPPSLDTIIHCPLTLAGVYTDDFFLPVSSVSQKSNIETVFLEAKMRAPLLPNPSEQQGVSWLEIKNILSSLDSSEHTYVTTKDFVINMPEKIHYRTIATAYSDLSSPFYTISTPLTNRVQEIEFPVRSIALTEDNFCYLRQPFAENSDYQTITNMDPNLHMGEFSLTSLAWGTGSFTSHQFTNAVIASLEHDPFQEGDWVQWHTQSFSTQYVTQYANALKMTPSKISVFEIDSTFAPRNEAMRLDIGQFSSNIFRDTEFKIPQSQFTSLSILKSAQKEVIAAVKTESSPLYCCKASITATTYNSPPPANRVRMCKYIPLFDNEDHFSFTRNVSYDQKNALFAYRANIDESIPNNYYLLPQLDLTRIAFISLSGQEPELLTTKPFSQQAVLKELARGKNQANRFTHMDLCSIPSLEFLQTDSLSDEFDTLVRVLPKKTGDGTMFSILLSPFDKASVDATTNHIYFLIDRSSTMEEHRFYTFKKAISQSLTYLEEGTPFNIALFDYETEWLNERDLIASKNSINFVRKKLKSITQRGKSNIQTFASLIDNLKAKAYRTGEPHTLILLSDGRFMKNIRIQRHVIKSITDDIPDAFSLYAASTSDNNNLGMLDLITGLCRGDAVHSKTHASFSRKLASLTKRVHKPVGYCVKVTQINDDNTTQILDNSGLSRSIYADKVFKIYGETSSKNDINLLIQAYNGDRWLNIPKTISFKNGIASPTRLASDFAKEQSLLDFLYFIQTGNANALNQAQTRLIQSNLPSPIR